MEFSVLMSVYNKENPIFLEQSLESILINQTLLPTELVLVKDGPLTDELNVIIDNYQTKFLNLMNIVELKENQGLGNALNYGLSKCKYELVARMDSDDICNKIRFEEQINWFKKYPKTDLVGGNIVEFYDEYTKPIAERKVHANIVGIKNMMKRRNPINHVTVMFKKSAVIKAGGYKHLPYLEDYYLWIRMIEINCSISNIDKTLVYVRTGDQMYKRRGNKEYISGWYVLQKKMKSLNMINDIDLIINMLNIVAFIYMPSSIKKIAYEKVLRD